MNANAVIVAAGKGLRLGNRIPKQFLALAEKPILARSLEAFDQHPQIAEIVVVGAADWLVYIEEQIIAPHGFRKVSRVVRGGKERQDSVAEGVLALPQSALPVLVHDAARPFVSAAVISRVIAGLPDADACIPTVPVADTIKEVKQGWVVRTLARDRLRKVQTPQGFWPQPLLQTLEKAKEKGLCATDEAYLIEHFGGRVSCVDGDPGNIKVTTEWDLKFAEWMLEEQQREDRDRV